MRPIFRVLPLVLAAAGCAPTLSTLQSARTLEPGQVQVTGGLGFFIPAGPLLNVGEQGWRQGQVVARALQEGQPYALSEQDQQALLTAGIALAVAPPGSSQELMGRVGLTHGLEAGVRLSTTSVRVDGKLRLLHWSDPDSVPESQRRSVDVALGLAGSRHLFRSPVFDLLEVVRMDDFSRYDLEVPLYLSAEWGGIFKLYGAPKYVYGRTELDQRLVATSNQGQALTGFDVALPSQVDSHFFGASAGLAVGYKVVHLYAEITGGYTLCRPFVLGQVRDLGGPTFFPAVGLVVTPPAPSASKSVPALAGLW